jgi:hypothetical protein
MAITVPHRLVEVPVYPGQSITVCLNTFVNDRVPGRRVMVELRVSPDGTPEVRLAPEDIEAGIVHTQMGTDTCLTAPR